jgi:membrane associated rhomboid family serine protease
MSEPNDKANGKQEENLPSDSSENQQPSTEEILREVLKTATFFLFGVCLVAFIITVIKDALFFEFSNATLISLGGAFNINIYDGEYWRIFTATFLHDGFFHLLFNMFFFVVFWVIHRSNVWKKVVYPYFSCGSIYGW